MNSNTNKKTHINKNLSEGNQDELVELSKTRDNGNEDSDRSAIRFVDDNTGTEIGYYLLIVAF